VSVLVRGTCARSLNATQPLGTDIVINYSTDKSGADAMVGRVQGLGVKAVAVQGDVTQLFETAQSTFAKIDIVIANADLRW
jgi:NAD(P)-dependent dehydrogenase (short-subunit alcohol dehydrogenase family)